MPYTYLTLLVHTSLGTEKQAWQDVYNIHLVTTPYLCTIGITDSWHSHYCHCGSPVQTDEAFNAEPDAVPDSTKPSLDLSRHVLIVNR